jgi:hypothetical protein
MGGMGIHRAEQGPLHAHSPHQYSHVDGRSGLRREALFLFSSGCVYAGSKQQDPDIPGLKKRTLTLPIQKTAGGREKLL